MRIEPLHGKPLAHRNLTERFSELNLDISPGYRGHYSITGDQAFADFSMYE